MPINVLFTDQKFTAALLGDERPADYRPNCNERLAAAYNFFFRIYAFVAFHWSFSFRL